MMLVLLLPNGECHINSYRLTNGNYRTVCAITIEKNAQNNTLSADDTFPGTCETCKRYYDEMYQDDLNHQPAMARSITYNKYQSILDYHRSGIMGPEVDHYGIEERQWWRINKYKGHVNGRKEKPKKKFKFILR